MLLELNRMVSYLKNHAEEFAELLAQKTTKDYERELCVFLPSKKHMP